MSTVSPMAEPRRMPTARTSRRSLASPRTGAPTGNGSRGTVFAPSSDLFTAAGAG